MKIRPEDSRGASSMRFSRCMALAGFALTMAGAAVASPPAPFVRGEPRVGEPVNEKDCIACYVRRVDGDADRGHMRSERRSRAPSELLAQTSYCSAELGSGYFPEEEEHIAAYLNKRRYRFE
jgi:hypothetical protein